MYSKHTPTKLLLAIVLLLTAAVVGFFAFPAQKVTAPPLKAPTPATLDDVITVETPLPNTTVITKNPASLTVSGKARGTWFFEATAPIELTNASGRVIASGHITAQGDWMTTEYIPFSGTLSFPTQPNNSTGTLILKNDNPSDDPTTQKELHIPVTFRDHLDLP